MSDDSTGDAEAVEASRQLDRGIFALRLEVHGSIVDSLNALVAHDRQEVAKHAAAQALRDAADDLRSLGRGAGSQQYADWLRARAASIEDS